MKRHLLYTVLTTLLVSFSFSSAEVKVIDHTEKTKKELESGLAENTTKTNDSAKTDETPEPEQKKDDRTQRIQSTYVLKDRETGKVITFDESSIDEVVDSLRAMDVPMEKWHSCSSQPEDTEPSLEDIEKTLDMTLLIESLAGVPAPELTDSQRDWVKKLSPCAPDMRRHLKALSLILNNYKLIKKPDA